MIVLGAGKPFFHTPEAHTNRQYIPKHPNTFNSCPIELKLKCLKALNILRIIAISILHIMPLQRRTQSLALFHSSTPQRPLRNRLLTTCAIENNLLQSYCC